jgi:hypothetical protein
MIAMNKRRSEYSVPLRSLRENLKLQFTLSFVN